MTILNMNLLSHNSQYICTKCTNTTNYKPVANSEGEGLRALFKWVSTATTIGKE